MCDHTYIHTYPKANILSQNIPRLGVFELFFPERYFGEIYFRKILLVEKLFFLKIFFYPPTQMLILLVRKGLR